MAAPIGEGQCDLRVGGGWHHPRRLLLALLPLTGAGIGEVIHRHFDLTVAQGASTLVGGFAVLVWGAFLKLYGDLSTLTEIEGLSSADVERMSRTVKQAVRKLYAFAFLNLILATLAFVPALVLFLKARAYWTDWAWHGLIVTCGGVTGLTAFFFLVSLKWQDDIRDFKVAERLKYKQRVEQQQLIQELEQGLSRKDSLANPRWDDLTRDPLP